MLQQILMLAASIFLGLSSFLFLAATIAIVLRAFEVTIKRRNTKERCPACSMSRMARYSVYAARD